MPRIGSLVLDSSVVVRCGEKQAGADKGYNPRSRDGRATTRSWPSFRSSTIWWGFRLVALQDRRPLEAVGGILALDEAAPTASTARTPAPTPGSGMHTVDKEDRDPQVQDPGSTHLKQ